MIVGITFFLHKDRHSLWSNGGFMNNVFLWRAFKHVPGVEMVYAINAGEADVPHDALMLRTLNIQFVRLDEVIDRLDLLIECGAQVSAEAIERVKRRGGKAVGYRFGNAYVLDGEKQLYKKEPGSIFNGSRFDAIWTTAQHMNTCGSYWEACYRAPVRVLPHIWEPIFIELTKVELQGVRFGYVPGRKRKRVSIFEPNIDVVKMCHIPMLVCELAHRQERGILEHVYVTNSIHLKEHETFQGFAKNLDMVRDLDSDGRPFCSFEARYNTPWFLAANTDVVVTHQWENALNYLYYDALYGRYPLVHNSPMLPAGVGYRYSGFDAHQGAEVLGRVVRGHDQDAEGYARRAHAFLQTVNPFWAPNIEAHRQELQRVFAGSV